jgi:uncharacterized protein (TIGR02145 family)
MFTMNMVTFHDAYMKIFRTLILTLLLPITVCLAQSYNISGIVKNSVGNGIDGALVRLGKADISATTGPDGSFTIKGTITGVKHPANPAALHGYFPFVLRGNSFLFSAANNTEVKVTVYDCRGRLRASLCRVVPAGNNAIALPRFVFGAHICQVSLNNDRYTFKSIGGTTNTRSPASSINWTVSLNKMDAMAPIEDALLCIKDGFKLYRLAIRNPNTAGILITMTPLVTGIVTDIDGNEYRTLQFGNQVWTIENLRTTKYNDGQSIPLVTDSVSWAAMTTPAYCFFNYTGDTAAQRQWGALYNWYAVHTGKLAPTGWHVSTDEDWDTLQNYLIANGYNFDGTTGENKIAKAMSAQTGWLTSTDTGASGNDTTKNNASGFSGLPNGYCDYDGYTYYRSWYAFWWTATEQDSTFVKIRTLSYTSPDLKSTAFTKIYGLSVRLVLDK